MEENLTETEICDVEKVHPERLRAVREELPPIETVRRTAGLFKALGDETRMRILLALDRGELCVCDIAALLGMTKSAISHQLALLRQAELLQYRRDGKEVYYAIADGHVHSMLEAGLEHALE